MSNNLEEYYMQVAGSTDGTIAIETISDNTAWRRVGDFPCLDQYIHYPWIYPLTYTTVCDNRRDDTETAFKIIKKLVEIGVIEEPKSFKDFCKIIDEIKKIL